MSAAVKSPVRGGQRSRSTSPSFLIVLASDRIAVANDVPGTRQVPLIRTVSCDSNLVNGRIEAIIRSANGSLGSHFGRLSRWGRDTVRLGQDIDAPEVVAADYATRWQDLKKEVAVWGDLEPDWDGDDGRAPAPALIGAGLQIIGQLASAGVPLPEHYVAGDGELGFRWRTSRGYASLSLVDDGDLLIYMHQGDRVLHNDDIAWTPDVNLAAFIGDLTNLV